jgi:type IV pilus assembly protein PilW
MVSRGISGTVSDASAIQQQAAYAMRLFGQQLRQAGSMRLNLDPGTTVTEDPHRAAVAFETVALSASSPTFSYNAATADQVIRGADAPDTLTVGFRRYTEPVFTDAAGRAQVRNCLGGPDDTASTHERMESAFSFNAATNTLNCNGNGAGAQPVLQNVANFQVRYLLQDVTTTPGIATVKTVDATAVGANWAQVQAVEVCLVLYGNEAIDMPADGTSTYRDCDAAGTPIDMAALTGTRARRMHIAFRNVFQLRSQGLIGSVLNPA